MVIYIPDYACRSSQAQLDCSRVNDQNWKTCTRNGTIYSVCILHWPALLQDMFEILI